MDDCLFCKIIAGDIPSDKLYEDELVYAFRDIDPQAPVHFLVVPKAHISGADALGEADGPLLARVFSVAAKLCAQQGITKGYRVVTNVGPEGGQSVGHLHFHVLAGRQMGWPPG